MSDQNGETGESTGTGRPLNGCITPYQRYTAHRGHVYLVQAAYTAI